MLQNSGRKERLNLLLTKLPSPGLQKPDLPGLYLMIPITLYSQHFNTSTNTDSLYSSLCKGVLNFLQIFSKAASHYVLATEPHLALTWA